MLFKLQENAPGGLKKMQLETFPLCSRFEQEIVDDTLVVRYLPAPGGMDSSPPGPAPAPIEISLEPELSSLEKLDVVLHKSPTAAYRMGASYNKWFSECFGFEVILVYIGDGKRPALGTLSPKAKAPAPGAFSSLMSYVSSSWAPPDPDWLTFTDVAPVLVVSEASLNEVSSRIQGAEKMDVRKFRPNIVVDGEGKWDEDYWSELTCTNGEKILLTHNCGRCTSINVDYRTGRPGTGDSGAVLKKLMKDRRVDPGHKYAPIFGRYGFLPSDNTFTVSVGDDVSVTGRNSERTVFDWDS
jgi:uncharacterized protein YcbX